MRQVSITPNVNRYAEGSALIEFGHTRVLCTASVEEKVPPFLEGRGKGWVTAEYAMLPRSTHSRCGRNGGGRGTEIQRLVGRSLRGAVSLRKLGPRQIIVDCDVLQADGGTRTAAITGGWVALALAVQKLVDSGKVKANPLKRAVCAISAGVWKNLVCLDLAYEEDSQADTDFNFVMTDDGNFIEMQGTAENEPFTPDQLSQMMALARSGADILFGLQKEVLKQVQSMAALSAKPPTK